MEKLFKVEDLDAIEISLPDSVRNPVPKFETPVAAIQFYSNKLEGIAEVKRMTLDEMRFAASAYKFGPEESFEILGLFDSISALKAATK